MITYNTQQKKLALPEYGRNVQQMIDHCLTIEDRDERTRCAYSIVDTMLTLNPSQRNNPDFIHKLWDHLAIMSGFALDIDYPFEITDPSAYAGAPDPIEYGSSGNVPYKYYGIRLLQMIDCAASMPEGEERSQLIRLLANHMKKQMTISNKDGVDDARVFSDLRHISHGAINIDPEEMKLHEYREAPQAAGKRRKHK